VEWFDRIKAALCRVLLRLSAQLHEPSGYAAIEATFFDREYASKYYQAIMYVHCTTEKRHDTQLGRLHIATPTT
jgi:IS5 family transposase